MASIVDVVCLHLEQVEIEISKSNPEQAKKGFLGGLFSRSSKEPSKLDEQQSEDEYSKGDETSLSTEQAVLLNEAVPQDIKDSLQHLIEQLASMDGYSEIADLLKKEVKSITQIIQLAKILEMITNAFVEISDQEHIQFEKFLKTLNTRIKRVNTFISDTLDYSKTAATDSKQLNTSLNTNFSGMKDSLTNSKSLEDATSVVFSHLDQMTEQLDQYCETQQKNSEQLVQQMDKLSEQLRATEDEASRLKDDLAEQRVRAQTDPLTNLPNRYSYNERLTQEYNRWRRYRNSLTLVIADIDLFKQVNDVHGHAFGDKVLKEIASFLSAGVRESDFIARFGGEEFIILLPETSIVDATRAMNKIRLGVSKLEITHQNTLVPVTLSFGLSEFDNDDTTKAVFERADQALYRAKEKGRNRVCCLRAKAEE
ncbi:MAG: diguanylate cyclase [Enterobacterales bacterium]|nr:diguanylate cyclase [Enterobacterales bacterium]